jgi:hypothetical protein
MAFEAHVARIQTALGECPPRNQRFPVDLFTPFFEDLWKAGMFPTGSVVQKWLPQYDHRSATRRDPADCAKS